MFLSLTPEKSGGVMKVEKKTILPGFSHSGQRSGLLLLRFLYFIEQHPDYVKDKIVVELGAGLSIPSFMASRYARSVMATDLVEDAVEITRLNIEKLGIENISAEMLDWNKVADRLLADTILMS
jgi:predicted nicotinamide N-methyase